MLREKDSLAKPDKRSLTIPEKVEPTLPITPNRRRRRGSPPIRNIMSPARTSPNDRLKQIDADLDNLNSQNTAIDLLEPNHPLRLDLIKHGKLAADRLHFERKEKQ